MIWTTLLIAAVIALLIYARKGPNALWGTATIGILIGLVVAIFQSGFDWWAIGKGLIIGTGLGLLFEVMGALGSRTKK